MLDIPLLVVRQDQRPPPPPECIGKGDVSPQIYHYAPNMFAAVLFLVLFSLSNLFHTYQMVRTKTWFWTWFIFGGLLQFIGFVGRVIGAAENPCFTIPPYVIMTLGTLLGPALFAASIYMVLGRIMLMVDGSHHSLVRRQWMTGIFVTGDVVSFLMQCGGGGLTASKNPDTANLGETIVIVGLFVQIVFFGLFMINSVLWWYRIRADPTPLSRRMPWLKHLIVLFVASFLIFFRSIFRLVEYFQGRDGYLMSHEVFLYVMDVALMFLVMAGFHYWHPSEITALRNGSLYAKLWWIRIAIGTVEEVKESPALGVDMPTSDIPLHNHRLF